MVKNQLFYPNESNPMELAYVANVSRAGVVLASLNHSIGNYHEIVRIKS